eukprot:Clim_evm61s225 gene=Clim_evmTU61s225
MSHQKPGANAAQSSNHMEKPPFIYPVQYFNRVPDVPVDPKTLEYPHEKDRFVGYNQTELERRVKHNYHAGPLLGIKIDLMSLSQYAPTPPGQFPALHPDDQALLKDAKTLDDSTKRRQNQHAEAMSFMRRAEITIPELERMKGYGDIKREVESKTKEEDSNLFLPEEQIKFIQKTFDDVMNEDDITHPSKPGMKPVSVKPVFPDFDLWHFTYHTMVFDSNPLMRKGEDLEKKSPEEIERIKNLMELGIVRVQQDSTAAAASGKKNDEVYLEHFVPTDEALKRKLASAHDHAEAFDRTAELPDEAGETNENGEEAAADKETTKTEEYDYRLTREYDWNRDDFPQNRALVLRDTGKELLWNQMPTRLRLTRRKNPTMTDSRDTIVRHTKLRLKHRKFNELENERHDERTILVLPSAWVDDQQNAVDDENNGVGAVNGGDGGQLNGRRDIMASDDDDDDFDIDANIKPAQGTGTAVQQHDAFDDDDDDDDDFEALNKRKTDIDED